MRVLFLDVDGILSPFGAKETDEKICKEYDLKVVLS
tara:strand:+ start:8368 stop:8475 length:108 start_codon:yes stop_codon:yes gene_type:complete